MPGCGCFSRSGAESPKPATNKVHNKVMVPVLNRLVTFYETADGIKYNIGVAEVEKVFGTCSGDEQTTLKSKPSTTTLKSKPSISQQTPRSQRSKKSFGEPIPAYVDGQEIEYFSNTYQCWLEGVVQGTDLLNNDSNDESGFVYTIVLSKGRQVRQNVGLDFLRPLFEPGELVEFFSGRLSGARLAAVITENQLPSPSVLGHRVQVESSGDVFEKIPSLRLKRRYIPNQEVEVYRGHRQGWQLAKVHHTAKSDGCGEQFLFPGNIEQTASQRCAHRSVASLENGFVASEIGLWSLVPLCAQTGQEDVPPEWIPSYLIRFV